MQRTQLIVALTVACSLVAGCPPSTGEGVSACRGDGDCPASFPRCRADMRCWSTPDPSPDAFVSLPDAGADANAMDARTPQDSGSDAGDDAGSDAGNDAGNDAGSDAGNDAATPRFALSFDGTDDQVQFPTDLGSHVAAFTLEVWARPTSSAPGSAAGEGGVLFEHAGGCTGDFSLEWSGNVERQPHRYRMWVYPTTGCGHQVSAEASFTTPIGSWHHVAGVFDGGAVRLYVDGVMAASVVQSDPISWAASMGHWAGRDGRDSRPTRGAFIGEIDEIRVSSTARYSGTGFVPPTHLDPDSSTVAAWLFDEGTGATTVDASGHGYGGTITGASWVAATR